MVNSTIQKAIDFAKPYYEKRDHHKWNHIEDVLSRAKIIGESVELDWEILELGIILHDIIYDNYKTHVDDSVKLAKEYLKSINYPKNKAEKVIEVIYDHSRPHRAAKGDAKSNEGKVIYDADKTSFINTKEAYDGYVNTLYFGKSKEIAKNQIELK